MGVPKAQGLFGGFVIIISDPWPKKKKLVNNGDLEKLKKPNNGWSPPNLRSNYKSEESPLWMVRLEF